MPLSDNSCCSEQMAWCCQRFRDSCQYDTLGQGVRSWQRLWWLLFHGFPRGVTAGWGDWRSGTSGLMEWLKMPDFARFCQILAWTRDAVISFYFFFVCVQQRSKNCSGAGSAGWFMLMFKGQSMGCSPLQWHSGKEAVCGKDGVEIGREALTTRPCFYLSSVIFSCSDFVPWSIFFLFFLGGVCVWILLVRP